MANTFKIPSPSDLLKPTSTSQAPNNGGIPTIPAAPQRLTIPARPAVQSGPPGPAPAALPVPTIPAPPAAMPVPGGPATAPAAPATGQAPTFTFNFAAPPTAPAPPTTAGGELWPDAQAPQAPQSAGGELWPDVQAPTAPSSPQAPPAAPTVEQPYRPVRTINYVPQRFEVDTLAPGEAATTPVGDVYRDPNSGALKLKLNDAGKQAVRQWRAQRLRAFGDYPMSNDPMAPTPPVQPGMPTYDAFRGRWIE